MVSPGGFLAVTHLGNRSSTEGIDVIIDSEHADDRDIVTEIREDKQTIRSTINHRPSTIKSRTRSNPKIKSNQYHGYRPLSAATPTPTPARQSDLVGALQWRLRRLESPLEIRGSLVRLRDYRGGPYLAHVTPLCYEDSLMPYDSCSFICATYTKAALGLG